MYHVEADMGDRAVPRRNWVRIANKADLNDARDSAAVATNAGHTARIVTEDGETVEFLEPCVTCRVRRHSNAQSL